jgi:TolB-like protein/Tfp pilus assembly protein PilF
LGNGLSFFEELKRRNVVRVGIAYTVTSWLVLQLADIIVDNLPVPDWTMQAIMLALVCGLPVVLVFAWAFELTPEGLKKEKDVDRSESITNKTGRKLDRAIIVILVFALGYFVFDKFAPFDSGDETPGIVQAKAPEEMESGPEKSAPAGTIPEKSIAVLPFVNMSSDADQEYFSDGISEELLNVLAKFPGVHVAARTSSFQFKGQNQDIGEIAKMLKVRHVLEGSVRKSGNKVRITAQLIEADTGYHLWSETYDREIDDIFAVQDEISAAIGDAMRVELALSGGQQAAPKVAESSNTAAYEAFLQGRHLVNQRGRRNIFSARDHLERSVRLDPDYAPAQAWLAIAHSLLLAGPSTYGDYTTGEMIRAATPHAEKAMELDNNLAEAYGARGLMALNIPDLPGAMSDLERALELNPVYVDAMTWYMLAAQGMGDWKTTVDTARQIVEVDPLSVVGRMNYTGVLSVYDVQAARDMAMSIEPQNRWAAYTARGNAEFNESISQAMFWLLRAYGEDPADEFSNQGLMYVLSILGESEEAVRISDRGHHYVELFKGNAEAAVHIARANLANDPENNVAKLELADMLYAGRQPEMAAGYYESVMKTVPDGAILLSPVDLTTSSMMRYAWVLSQSGDTASAEELVQRHRASYQSRESIGYVGPFDYVSEAIARAVEGDEQGVVEMLTLAVDTGYRDISRLQEPAFDFVQSNPAILALGARLQSLLEAEHKEALNIMCHGNPVPDTWQPMARTCMGVESTDT